MEAEANTLGWETKRKENKTPKPMAQLTEVSGINSQ